MHKAGIFIQIICAVLAAFILSYLFANGRKSKTTYSYMLCIVLLLFWNLAEILLLMSSSANQEMLAMKIKFIPVVYIGASWLYFCLTITNNKIVSNRVFKSVLFLVPTICYLFLLTNEYHHLFFKEVIFKTKIIRGPVFWIHTAGSYSCIFIGTLYFILSLKKTGITIGKNILFVLAVLAPITANILVITNVIPNKGFDITSQVLLITLIIFGIAAYQKKFLNLIPVATRHFIENMSDGIVIIDHDSFVVGLNDSINIMLPGLELKMYDPIKKLSNYIRKNAFGDKCTILSLALESSEDTRAIKGNFKIYNMDIYMEIGTLTGFRQSLNGKVLIIKDRSEEQQLLNEIKQKNVLLTQTNKKLVMSNKLLIEANHRLEHFSKTAEELAITTERNRMGRDVHDTLGHTLTLIIALAENVKSGLNEGQIELSDMVDKSIDISRQALNDIRSSLKGMCAESFENANLSEWLNDLTNNYLSSGTKIEVSISESIPTLDTLKAITIYRICQESITNAIRHGKAKKVSIIIKGFSNNIRVYIFNDGKGCREIVKGYGLTGMEQRVVKVGGDITFGSDGEEGFNIIANIPI